jgi:hypothetical protein
MNSSFLTTSAVPAGRALPVLVVLFVFAVPARAETLNACVRCTGPDQTYRCNVMSDEVVRADAVRLFCMSQIAREHVHESCAVLRGTAACDGVNISYVYQDGVGGDPAGVVAGAPGAAVDEGPGTLADMTKPAMEASVNAGKAVGQATVKAGKAVGEATVKAGQAVGDATTRTLKCLGSALNGC